MSATRVPPAVDLRGPEGAFRAILIGVCAVLASLPNNDRRALVTCAGLALLTWVVLRWQVTDVGRLRVAYLESAIAGLAVAANGGSGSPLLPYLLAPGLALGLLAGPQVVAQGALVAMLALLAGRGLADTPDDVNGLVVNGGQWVLLGLGAGLVASWARRQALPGLEPGAGYAEARSLLEQLRSVTRNLPGGLDAETAATALLEQAAAAAPNMRSAVLVQTVAGGALVPIAVRGTRRVPWRTPLTEPGPLRRAWDSQRPVVDRRPADKHGRRRGGALAIVPLSSSKTSYGLLVMEALDDNAFPADQLEQLRGLAAGVALQLETALLFDEVRSVATAEERDRLARQMHDGVAQELAFIGYQLDDLRAQADKVDPALGERTAELRKDLTGLISNLRLSITDLKTNVNADRGLGSALGAYIRAASSGRQLAIHLSLQESPFRLPAEREVALFHIAQVVAQDVRQGGQARNLWVNLAVDPPSARLVVEHDGRGPHELAGAQADLERLGGSLDVRRRAKGGIRVEATFGGASGDDPTSAD